MSRTIFACSSGAGRAGISVWRVSGPDASAAMSKIVGDVPSPRRASYRIFRDSCGDVIDDGIVLFFPGPHSVTGEDLAEFHTHGSPAVRTRMAELFAELSLSAAHPGEFTLRAFENGRMDLLAVEALGDLLDAETELQRRQAIAISQGEATSIIATWRDGLISALATLEAAVDFPDEEDVPENIATRALPQLEQVRLQMEKHLSDNRGKRILEGLTMVIVGAPNAGKSSFLNRLLGENRAIVSDIAGTTRDIVSERINIADRLVRVLDTAGIRDDTADVIEGAGIERAVDAANSADIVVWVRDATGSVSPLSGIDTQNAILIDNKADLSDGSDQGGISVSLKTGQGWNDALAEIERRASDLAIPSLFPHERQQSLIRQGYHAVSNAIATAQSSTAPELVAEDVRACLSSLEQLEGRQTTEAVLGEIFSSFCIGK